MNSQLAPTQADDKAALVTFNASTLAFNSTDFLRRLSAEGCRFLLALVLLCVAALSYGQELDLSGGHCPQDQQRLTLLREKSQLVEDTAERIEALALGSTPETLNLEELEALLSGSGGENLISAWPKTIRCEPLQSAYQQARSKLARQIEHLRSLRQTGWQNLPRQVRADILNIWRSRQRLLQNGHALQQALQQLPTTIPTANTLAAIQTLDATLQTQRLTFFRLLPLLHKNISADELGQWLSLWRQSLLLLQTPLEPAETLLQALPADARAAVEDHYQIALLDALVMSNSFNDVRGWLWKNAPDQFRQAMGSQQIDKQNLVLAELQAIQTLLHWLYIDANVDYRLSDNGGNAIVWRFFQGFGYFFGLLGFVLLIWAAPKIKHPAAALQARYARHSRRNSFHGQISLVTAGLPELLPWVVAWLGLELLEVLFKSYHLVLLLPLIPFVRLYILYGLVRLSCEWLVSRILQQAAVYPNEQQSENIKTGARRTTGIIILPWLLKDLAALSIGPSLLQGFIDNLTLLALFVAVSFLLKPWRREFILALQSFLPQAVDNLIARSLSSPLFFLLAPLAIPVLLAALMISFIHKCLGDFDWYRKLVARSFKLRSGAQEAEEPLESDQNVMAQYRHWFTSSIETEQIPLINIELQDVIEQTLTPWLNEHSEENTLLLTGERGTGKTTAIKRLRDKLLEPKEGLDVHYIAVPDKQHRAQDAQALIGSALQIDLSEGPAPLVSSDAERKPTIVILEDAQNFFLREVGGLAGWETLLSLTHARLINIFWVIAINDQSWAYLSNVFGRDYQFSKVLKTRPWSQSEIRSLILSRNQLSGFRIVYDDILLASRGPEAGNIRNAEQLFFSLLWDACRGNPLLAQQMWLSSISVKGNTVTVGLPVEVSSASLERLGEEFHFVYAALVLHENMTSEELVAATAMPQGVVRSALKTAFDIGFVERSVNRRYRIVPLWYPTITKLLTRKNLLNE